MNGDQFFLDYTRIRTGLADSERSMNYQTTPSHTLAQRIIRLHEILTALEHSREWQALWN